MAGFVKMGHIYRTSCKNEIIRRVNPCGNNTITLFSRICISIKQFHYIILSKVIMPIQVNCQKPCWIYKNTWRFMKHIPDDSKIFILSHDNDQATVQNCVYFWNHVTHGAILIVHVSNHWLLINTYLGNALLSCMAHMHHELFGH